VASAAVGEPKAVADKVGAFVTGGGFDTRVKLMGGVSTAVLRYRVTFVCRVLKQQAAAEATVIGCALAFAAGIEDDRTLGGTCNSADVDASVADTPQYVLLADEEFRYYPVVVSVTLQRGFSPVTSQ
jgi:hypothetical protein